MSKNDHKNLAVRFRTILALGFCVLLVIASGAGVFYVIYLRSPAPPLHAMAAIDPEMVQPLAVVPRFDLNDMSLPILRMMQGLGDHTPMPPPAPQPAEKFIGGPQGAPPIRLIIFDPAPGTSGRGAFLYMHGGGYVLGSARQRPAAMQRLAMTCGCVVVSVDYRLAPEARYPASLEDNYAALLWVRDHAADLGIDPSRIAIGGHSAGAGHAAMLAIAARDRGQVAIAFQVLIYPMLDDRTGSSIPASAGTGDYIWTAAKNQYGWSALLGVPAGSKEVPPMAVPARIENLAGLPPAFVGVGSTDLFRDEDIAYANRLKEAGVAVTLDIVPGAYHAFDGIAPNAQASIRFTNHWIELLRTVAGPV